MALKNLMGKSTADEARTPSADEAPKAAIRGSRSVAPVTSIDATTKLTGKIRCKETIRIDGRLKGEVRCEKSVIVGDEAVLDASVHGDEVVVSGTVKGDISAKRKITLKQSARVTGDLATPGIVIEEGAKLEGRIVIGAEEVKAQVQKPATPAQRSSEAATARRATPATA
jgi:cytoskeletal protein CcmA (bactofilin family)